MFYLQKKLWRVCKLRIITKTTPKPLDLTSNGVKTRITIVSKLRGGCDILCRCHFCYVWEFTELQKRQASTTKMLEASAALPQKAGDTIGR